MLPPADLVLDRLGNVVVQVPQVATTASDGRPRVLRPGRLALALPVWEAPNASAQSAWLEVGSQVCTPVDLRPGAVVRAACGAVLQPGTVTVQLVTEDGPVASWQHVVR